MGKKWVQNGYEIQIMPTLSTGDFSGQAAQVPGPRNERPEFQPEALAGAVKRLRLAKLGHGHLVGWCNMRVTAQRSVPTTRGELAAFP